MPFSTALHELIMQGVVAPPEPSRLDKIAQVYLTLDPFIKGAKEAGARTVEVQDVIGAPSALHPGHMSNVEAGVVDELVRQRQVALRKKKAEYAETIEYLMKTEGGQVFMKEASEKGELLADWLWDNDRAAALELIKGAEQGKEALNFEALAPLAREAGATATDMERELTRQTLQKAVSRTAVGGTVGYGVGRASGKTEDEKAQRGFMGGMLGATGGALSAYGAGAGAKKQLNQLALLESATKQPGSAVMGAGTSLQREQLIDAEMKRLVGGQEKKASEDLIKVAGLDELYASLAERGLVQLDAADCPEDKIAAVQYLEQKGHIDVDWGDEPVKIAEGGDHRFYVMPIDKTEPGSLLAALIKAAGEESVLSALPIGKMLAGAGIGAAGGNLLTGKDKKHETRNTVLGAVGGAGAAFGLHAPAAKTVGHEVGALGASSHAVGATPEEVTAFREGLGKAVPNREHLNTAVKYMHGQAGQVDFNTAHSALVHVHGMDPQAAGEALHHLNEQKLFPNKITGMPQDIKPASPREAYNRHVNETFSGQPDVDVAHLDPEDLSHHATIHANTERLAQHYFANQAHNVGGVEQARVLAARDVQRRIEQARGPLGPRGKALFGNLHSRYGATDPGYVAALRGDPAHDASYETVIDSLT